MNMRILVDQHKQRKKKYVKVLASLRTEPNPCAEFERRACCYDQKWTTYFEYTCTVRRA